MKIKAFAKINLALDILGKSENYHLIQTVLQEISLHDTLIFKKRADKKFVIKSNLATLPRGRNNTVYRAVLLMKSEAERVGKFFCGLDIFIEKNIPVAAGLGGGSSDAAATLKILNKIWKLNFDSKYLQKLAAQIGMDAPFFINSGTALATHFGEKILQLPQLPKLPILILKNGKKISTKKMYQEIDTKKTGANVNLTKELIKRLKNRECNNIYKFFHNDFELLDAFNKPKILNLKKKLLCSSALCVVICGSGLAMYVLYKDFKFLSRAYKAARNHPNYFLT